MPLTVAIIGRPNVGKSTLFNRLAGARRAIVDDTPGVTRDRSIVESDLAGISIRLIDTAGFDEGPPGSLAARIRTQTNTAISESDLCLFLVDARAGITAADQLIAGALRKSGKPVLLVANKAESAASESNVFEASALGLGDAIAVSAEHGLGLADLHDALLPYLENATSTEAAATET